MKSTSVYGRDLIITTAEYLAQHWDVFKGFGETSTGTLSAAIKDYRYDDDNVKAKMPIVLMRDKILQEYAVELRIVFGENEYFEPGFAGNWAHRSIIAADYLSKPQIWDGPRAPSYYFGDYGPAKHYFMIETADHTFDNEWMEANFTYNGSYWNANDMDYMEYLAAWLQRKLNEQNESTGEILTEADGTVVKFQ